MGSLACVLLIQWVTSEPWRINSIEITWLGSVASQANLHMKEQKERHSFFFVEGYVINHTDSH
jgi:hypothetical protein